MIGVNKKICKEVGELISKIEIKGSKSISNNEDLEYERLLWIIHTVIAHQINSFFLEEALRKIPKNKFNSKYLEQIDSNEISELIKNYHRPERILANERANMINEFCKVLNKKYNGKISILLEKSNFEVKTFRKHLDNFKAFSEDPLRKKSNILIQLLSRFKLVDFKNPEDIDPAIDYHLIRLSLRNRRIEIKDENLKSKIINQESISEMEDKIIRDKVIEAFKITQEASRKTIPDLNWIEWHIARSICIRDEPFCNLQENTASDFLEFEFNNKCPLFAFCKKDKEYSREPLFKTSFY